MEKKLEIAFHTAGYIHRQLHSDFADLGKIRMSYGITTEGVPAVLIRTANEDDLASVARQFGGKVDIYTPGGAIEQVSLIYKLGGQRPAVG